MEKSESVSKKVMNYLSEGTLLIVLIALIIFFSVLSPYFFTRLNLTNILVQNVHIAIVSTAVLILMVSGNCDLSIGYQVSIISVLVTKMITDMEVNMWLAILCGLCVGVICGLVNGFLAQKLKCPAMMATLATMAVYEGISYEISQSKTFFNLPRSFMFLGQGRIFGIPLNVIIGAVIIIIAAFVIGKTYLGRYLYAAGSNPNAAILAGVKVNKVKLVAFAFAGLMVGIAAVLLASRVGSADSTTGVGLEFTGITACVLGGCALSGGVGKLWKVIVAVYILGVLSNGMQLIGLDSYTQYIAKGLIMLLSIYLGNRKKTDIYAM